MIGLTCLSIMSISLSGSFLMLMSGALMSFGVSEIKPVNARIGLKTCNASSISCLLLTVTILGIVRSWATRFRKPSTMMMSVLFSHFFVMSLRLSFVVFVFSIVVSSFVATAVVMCAPAWVCLHVSRPFVSIVKSVWWMCLAVAIL